MAKEFQSFDEVIQDPIFIGNVSKFLTEAVNERNKRPEPKKGFKYKRDWVDQMNSENALNSKFILDHIKKVWERRSTLNSAFRKVVEYIGNQALTQTFKDYAETERVQELLKQNEALKPKSVYKKKTVKTE